MDKTEALRVIREYPTRWKRVQALQEELRELSAIKPTTTAGRLSAMPRGGGVSNPLEAHCIRIESMRESIEARLNRIVWEAGAVEAALAALTREAREVVTAREHERMTWEDAGARVGYTERHARRIHGAAVARMAEIMSEYVRDCPGLSETMPIAV